MSDPVDTGKVTINLSKGFDLKANDFIWEVAGPVSLVRLLNDWGSAEAPEVLEWLFDPETGQIADPILITLNGRSVKAEDPSITTVFPGDGIRIVPALTGG
ncbi:MAG: hypothetical protein LBH09_00440 [Peptococcaceae bacterium]|jgi:molybdopterin converting factor small subunit|nr:hypothetical protein [Peptococcaceae bacterium]